MTAVLWTVVAVVPTYLPDATLLDLLRALAGQVAAVVVVDDGSPCTADPVLRAVAALPGVRLVRLVRNRGVAAALAAGVEEAAGLGADAVLTVDQDSDLGPGYVAQLLATWSAGLSAGIRVGAVGAGRVQGPHHDLYYRTRLVGPGFSAADEVLQSGTLWPLVELRRVGGFREALVIDGVDTDACLRLQRSGAAVLVAPGLRLGHRIGSGRTVRLLGRDVLAAEHRPFRRYYMVRNRLRLLPLHVRVDPVGAALAARRLAVALALAVAQSPRRAEHAAAGGLGLWHAVTGRQGPLDPALRDRWG